MNIFFALLCFFTFSVKAQEVTPTIRVYQTLNFVDDMDFENMDLVIERQLKSFARLGLKGQIRFGTKNYHKSVLRDSLVLLKELMDSAKECMKAVPREECLAEFNRAVNEKFAIYKPRESKSHFTSYYSPDLHGSRVPTERFKRAIYQRPRHGENPTRVEIDYQGALAGKNLELFYVEESFYDLYLLHVQGGGRITVYGENGESQVKYLSYDGKNSHPFQMVYHYMLRQGYLKPGSAGIPDQRRFLQENPHKEEEVFGACPSYVYFKESDEEPVGLNNIPLTEGRSLAIDSRIYKTMGLINFVKTVKSTQLDEEGKPVKIPFSRFFVAQDTGGAIRGNARADLYFGYGPVAELTAYNMNEMGEQYFLIKK